MSQRIEQMLEDSIPLEERERKSTMASRGKTNLTLGVSGQGITFQASKSLILSNWIIRSQGLTEVNERNNPRLESTRDWHSALLHELQASSNESAFHFECVEYHAVI